MISLQIYIKIRIVWYYSNNNDDYNKKAIFKFSLLYV